MSNEKIQTGLFPGLREKAEVACKQLLAENAREIEIPDRQGLWVSRPQQDIPEDCIYHHFIFEKEEFIIFRQPE